MVPIIAKEGVESSGTFTPHHTDRSQVARSLLPGGAVSAQHFDDLRTTRLSPQREFCCPPTRLFYVSLTSAPPPTPALSSHHGVGDFSSDPVRPRHPAMHAPEPTRRVLLLCLGGLLLVCLLAQCTPTEHRAPSPQVQENTQAQILTPEAQLDLFNTFLDRA
jgi:hypothetical protein